MVIILTAGYGEGHNAAARGLHAAFQEIGFASEIIDPFALTGGSVYRFSRRAYLEVIDHVPQLWAGIYAIVDRMPVVPLALPAFRAMERAIGDLIAVKMPLAIVSVYPFYGYLVDALFKNATRPFRFFTVVTDSITINRVWHRCPSDSFFVANQASADVMIAAGVPEAKLLAFGFPVAPRFANSRSTRPQPTNGSRPRILFMVSPSRKFAPDIVARLLENPDISLTVTVGSDKVLGATIRDIAKGRPIEIHGWTDHMPELLMSHHILIGKAGGAAVQEAIAARTPMLITHIVPGQEEGNARLLVENECGAVCRTPEAIAAKVQFLFAGNAAPWRRWEENITHLSKPDAALQIARHIAGASKNS